MTATLLTFPVFRAFDSNGAPLAGGLLYSYQAGTTTPLATYVDQAGVTQNTNPVVLDSTGTANVWLGSSSYKLVLKDSEGVQQWSVDNIQSEGSQISSAVAAVYSDFANTSNLAKGDALVGVKKTGGGATTVHAFNENRSFNAKTDFGVVGDGVADDTYAVIAAVSGSANGTLEFPDGCICKLTGQIVISHPQTLKMGQDAKFVSAYSPDSNNIPLISIESSYVTLNNVVIDGNDHEHVGIKSDGFDHIIIDGGVISGCGSRSAVWIANSANSRITNLRCAANKINDGSMSLGAIYLDDCVHCLIDGCTITDFCGKGINLHGVVGGTALTTVSNCYVGSIQTDYADGIYVGYKSSYITIIGCHIQNAAGNGIKISRGAERCSVIGCTVDGTTSVGSGILLQGAVYCSVVGCKFAIDGDHHQLLIQPHANSSDSPHLEGSDCHGNVIEGCTLISLSDTISAVLCDNNADTTWGTFTAYRNKISNNYIYGGNIGVEVWSKSSLVVGNTIYTPATHGISVRGDSSGDASNSQICDNTISDVSGGASIFISFTSAQTGLSVCRNQVFNPGSSAIYATNLELSSISENVLMGAAVSSTYGIITSSGCQKLTISNNTISNFPDGVAIINASSNGVVANGNQMDAITNIGLYFNGLSGRFVGNYPGGGSVSITSSASVVNLGNS